MADAYPVLCGGTFFALLLEARRSRTSKRDNADGKTDGLSQPELLIELVRIIAPKFIAPKKPSTLKKNVGEYRQCLDNGGSYFSVVFESFHVTRFDEKVKTSYDAVFTRMAVLVNRFIDENKAERLVKALLETIEGDANIPDDAAFYINEKAMTKAELLDIDNVNLPSFLLGIWHYIAMNVRDNTVGQATFERWHIKKGETNSEWVFVSKIGRGIKRGITILPFADIADSTTDEQSITASSITLNLDNYKNAPREHYSKAKIILDDKTPRELRSFYVCNDVAAGPDIAIHDATADKLKGVSRFVVITGPGGYGKSLLLQHLLLDALENDDATRLPIFLQLRRYGDEAFTFFDYVLTTVREFDQSIEAEQLECALVNGQCLLLLDGADEIKTSAAPRFARELGRFADRYSKNQYIVSTRPQYSYGAFEKFTVLELRPFTKEQALRMVEKIDFRPEAPEVKARFLQQLEEELLGSHREFAENPLLLSIMLLIFVRTSKIPTKTCKFYQEAFDTLAERLDVNKGFERNFKSGLLKEQFEDCFAEICFRAHKEERYELTEAAFERYYNDLKTVAVPQRFADFWHDIHASLCLMYSDGGASRLIHRSFQEYFAALFLAKAFARVSSDSKSAWSAFLIDFFERHGYHIAIPLATSNISTVYEPVCNVLNRE